MSKENKKRYYAVTTTMTYEKTVLVPVDEVEDIDEAIDLVDCGVELASVDLLDEEAMFESVASPYADRDGIYELTDEEAEDYQVLTK